jgi:ribosomal protein S21
MSFVSRGANESIESLIRRFSKIVERHGIIAEARAREAFETPAEKARRKAKAKARSRRSR